MAMGPTGEPADAVDVLRAKLGETIAAFRTYTGPAGSADMRQVQQALNYMGIAYSCLQEENPAWDDD